MSFLNYLGVWIQSSILNALALLLKWVKLIQAMTEQEFIQLQKGDFTLLDKIFKENYQKVIETLRYKYQTDLAEAEDIYMEAILKFRDKVLEGKVSYGNFQAYLSRTAVNTFINKRRDATSRMKKMEAYLISQNDKGEKQSALEIEEERKEIEGIQAHKVNALRWAMKKLDKVCRDLLTDTIVLGLKPSMIFEKYGYKNARVLTDKKVRCKKALQKIVAEKLGK